MDTPENIKTRDEVLAFLGRASIYGNLGLFVGAGFSMAVMDRDFGPVPLRWGELIRNAAKALDVEFSEVSRIGRSFPEIATAVCDELVFPNNVSFVEATALLRGQIAQLTSWYPNEKERAEYSDLLKAIDPAWIITTNYDLVIETLLTGKCVSLGPEDQLMSAAGSIPVYHLHGVRTNPGGIVITQEDYVALFRPNQYRQLKLAMTFMESTTLILGYGLGDVNVLTAMDWSRNVFGESKGPHPHGLIQIFRTETPSAEPYKDKNDVIILETEDLKGFLVDLSEYLVSARADYQRQLQQLQGIADQLNKPDADDINRFIDDAEFRAQILHEVQKHETHLISGFLNFFQRCIDETWERAKPRLAFHAYEQNLSMLLDVLEASDVKKLPPALFQTLAYSLDRVAYFIGDLKGESWEGKKTWRTRKKKISGDTLDELRAIAKQSGYVNLLLKLLA